MKRALFAVVLLFAFSGARAVERAPDEVQLIPHDPAGFGLRNVGAAVTSIFGAWNYWYAENVVLIDTAPSDAQVDLFYIRANFQKLYSRERSPIRVHLPSRVHATPRDALIIRATANGYRSQEQSFKIGKAPEKLVMTLEPLPNALVLLSHTHLGARTSLTLRMTEKAEFRVMKGRGFPGFSLVLAETASRLEPSPHAAGGLLHGVEVTQIGEDLIVRVETLDPKVETRSKATYDAIREEHVLVLDLTEPGVPRQSSTTIRREIARADYTPGDPCDERFERSLREAFGPETLARAFRSSGTYADLYRREAMLARGRLDHGEVRTLSGERFRTGSALELEVALQSGPLVEGYLALLGAYARTQDDPTTVLRSLIAPEADAETFDPLYEVAEGDWSDCRRSRRH
jgi:hypothetical protein